MFSSFFFFSDVPAKLTVHQQQALFTSWKSLRPTIQTLMRKILNDLKEEVPEVKQVIQQRKFISILIYEIFVFLV